MRPDRLVLVVGTGTEVGKTWVSALILRRLRDDGVRVAARKPAQSYAPGDDPAMADAAVLGRASGEPDRTVCLPSRSYRVAMAPPMAADALGLPFLTMADLVGGIEWPREWPPGSGPTVGVVETAGGVRSPQAVDGDAVDLGHLLAPDLVVLVADAGLGTINAVRLCAAALAGLTAPLGPVVVLNRFDPASDLHSRNRAWLSERDGMRVLTVPTSAGDGPADASSMPWPARPLPADDGVRALCQWVLAPAGEP